MLRLGRRVADDVAVRLGAVACHYDVVPCMQGMQGVSSRVCRLGFRRYQVAVSGQLAVL